MRDLLLRQAATGSLLLFFNLGSLPGLYRLAATGVPNLDTPHSAYVIAQLLCGIMLCGWPLAQLGSLLDTLPVPVAIKLRRDTELLTLSTFGSRRQPVAAGAVAFGLSVWTSLTEEVAFRGCLLPVLAQRFDSLPAGVAASSILFGIAHWSLGDFSLEGISLLGLQTFYGLCFALTYLLFDGQGVGTLADGQVVETTLTGLVAAIGAHALYDFKAFYDTHLAVTGQVAYTQRFLATDAAEGDDVAKRVVEITRENDLDNGFVMLAKTVFAYLDDNRDGFLELSELRSGLCVFGTSLKGREGTPSVDDVRELINKVDVDENEKLDLAEWLQLVLLMEGDPQAMVSSLLYTP